MLELLECWFALSEEVELSAIVVVVDIDGACCWLVGLIVPQFVLPREVAAVVIVAVCFALPDEATALGAATTTLVVVSAGGVVVVVVDEEEEVVEIDTFGVVMLVVVAFVTVDSFNAGSLTDSFMLV